MYFIAHLSELSIRHRVVHEQLQEVSSSLSSFFSESLLRERLNEGVSAQEHEVVEAILLCHETLRTEVILDSYQQGQRDFLLV